MTTQTTMAEGVGADSRSTLDILLHPRSVAIVGASDNPKALGGKPMGLMAAAGFAGSVYAVNPTRQTVQGVPAYPSIGDVPERVDVALVMVRAELVPDALRECAAAGVGVAIVLSSGFGEGVGFGAELQTEIEALVGTTPMRILGPNCEGLASLPCAAPLTFSPVLDAERTGQTVLPGKVAVLSHSGGVGFAVAQWGSAAGIGFNYLVSTGNEADLDVVELGTGLLEDTDTEVLVLVLEGARLDGVRRLGVLARELGKHVVVTRLGRSEAGARGSRAHTLHLSGSLDGLREVCAREGMALVSDERELIDVLRAVARVEPVPGRRVGILTTSGGAGVLLADACRDRGLEVPELSPDLRATMSGFMPAYGSPVNPVDLTAQFIAGGDFTPAVTALLRSGEVDLVILVTSLASAGRLDTDRGPLGEVVAGSAVPLVVLTYTNPAPSCVAILEEVGVPWYTTSVGAAAGVAAVMGREGSAR